MVDVVIRREIDRHVDVPLDDADQMQVLLDLIHIHGHLEELGRLRPQILILDVQIEDVEERQARSEGVVKVLHSLVLGRRYLNVRVE